MRCAGAVAASGFDDAFDDFPPTTSAAETNSSNAPTAAEAQFGDFADLDEAQPGGTAATGAGSVTKEQTVGDLIAQLPDLSYMLERTVAPA